MHQAGPRGAARPGRDLHGGVPGHDRPGRLAAERVPDPRAGALLRRDLLPAPGPPGHALVDHGPGRRAGGVGRARGRDPGHLGQGGRAPARRGRPAARRRGAGRGRAGHRRRGPARDVRRRERRLRRRAQVPARVDHRVPAGPGRDRDEPAHAAGDGRRRHVRPGRRRLRPLLGRRALDRPPLREDALRQRAPGPRVPARLAGLGRRPAAARGRGDAGLDAHRAARARGRVHVRPGRRLRGRGGAVLRVDARPAARGAGTRGRRDGGRLLRRAPGRQLRGQDDPDPRRAGAGEPGRHPPAALRGPRAARLARAGRQAPDLLERAGHRRPGRGGRGAGAAALPGRRPRRGGLRAARPARRRRPPAAHLQGRPGQAERLPGGPRLPAGRAADAVPGHVRAALVHRGAGAGGHHDRALRRRRARRLLRDLGRPRAAGGAAQGPGGPPDPVGQLGRRAGPAAAGGADRRVRLRGARRGRAGAAAPASPRSTPTRSRTCCWRPTSTWPPCARWRWPARTPASWSAWSAPSYARTWCWPGASPTASRCWRAASRWTAQPAAYVCERFACRRPVTTPRELEALLASP